MGYWSPHWSYAGQQGVPMASEVASTVRYGIQLPIQAQSTLFAQPWEREATPDDLATVAVTADRSGYGYVAVCDHIAIPERLAGAMSTTWYDNVATLGWLAGITSTTRLLSHVHVLAYRHPAQSAHAFATLDHLSGGRVILGVGAGHVAEEFELLGLDFTRRGEILDERIAEVKRYLENEFVDGSGARPRPVTQPRPPIWVGGSSVSAIRRAAVSGEGWLPQGPPKMGMAAAIATIAELRASAGLNAPFAIGSITPFLHIGPARDDLPAGTIAGTADRLAASLQREVDLGVTDLQVRFAAASVGEQCDQMLAFAETVAPLLTLSAR